MSDQRLQQKGSNIAQRFFRRLRDGAPIEFCVEACQSVHSRYSACRQCERACPVGALRVTDSGIEVAKTCVGCGRCAVACSTGALALPGFALTHIDEEASPVYLDCWKVPVRYSPKGALRMPCLGGLSLSRLIELRVAAVSRAIVLLDRGWCEGCPAGGSNTHPAAGCANAARELMQSMHIPADQWPGIASQPLPSSLQAQTPSDRSTEQRLSRRAFFGDLAARATSTASEINPITSGKQAPIARGHERAALRSRDRDRLLAQVKALAATTGAAIPASLYPALRIDPQRCQHHRLCASTCPTGAIGAFDASGVSGIVFDSSACIACGHCEAICPDKALQLLPQGDGSVPAGPKVLARIRQRECVSCGRTFEGAVDDTHCPSCVKRTRLAGSAFQALFGRAN